MASASVAALRVLIPMRVQVMVTSSRMSASSSTISAVASLMAVIRPWVYLA
jgi:hypothetical protein